MTTLLNDYLANRLPRPEVVKLYIRISLKEVAIMMFNPYEEHSLAIFSLPLAECDDASSRLRELEKSIYNHAGLIELQWHFIEILIDAERFAVVPAELGMPEEIFTATLGNPLPGNSLITNSPENLNATFVAEIDTALLNFLHRTFVNAPVVASISAQAAYTTSRCNSSSPVLTANLSKNNILEITTSAGSGLLQATRFEVATIDDAAYYVLASAAALPEAVGEVFITGTSPRRNDLMTMLRRFHPYVMPLVFPSEMHRAGAEVGKIEFDLLVAPLAGNLL